MSFASVFFTTVALVAFVVWWYRKANRNHEFHAKFKCPPTLPLIGNAADVTSTTRILPLFLEYFQKYGDTVNVQIGPFHRFVVTRDYDLIATILTSTKLINKADEYKYIQSWLGTGLLTSKGALWKKRRRIITPAFHFQILEQFIDVFETAGNVLMKKLEGHAGSESLDVYPLVTLYALDVICETAMGINVQAQDNEYSKFVESVQLMSQQFIIRSFSALKHNDFLYRLTPDYYRAKKAVQLLHKHTYDVINARRAEIKAKQNNKDSADQQKNGLEDLGIKQRKAFLDLLLETTMDGEPLTDEEIREEVDTFMFAGHDTTASAISYGIYCIANSPEVQEKILQEQKQILGEGLGSASPSYADLQEMKYLEKVIKETLRLYPSVTLFGRHTDQEIEHKGMVIPKDVTFLVAPYAIHRHPKHFKDPEKFDPDRFDTLDRTRPFTYFPFSAGPRNCLGQKFSILEMKSALSKVVRRFKLRPAFPKHDLLLSSEVGLKSANGIKIGLELRN